MICYLMDENVNPIYKDRLLKDFTDLTVWAVGDAVKAPSSSTGCLRIKRWEYPNFHLSTSARNISAQAWPNIIFTVDDILGL